MKNFLQSKIILISGSIPLMPVLFSNTVKSVSITNVRLFVQGGNVNFRETAEMGDNIITSIKQGTSMQVVEDDGSSKFVKVKVGDKEGFVARQYVNIEDTSSTAPAQEVATPKVENKSYAAVVNTPRGGNLNFRGSPEEGDNIITSLKAGTPVEVLEDDGKSAFVKVKNAHREGYVARKYLKQTESTDSEESPDLVVAGVSGNNEEGTTVKNAYQAGSSVQVKTPKGGNLNLRSSVETF